MKLRQINQRELYLQILFACLWNKSEFIRVKTETKEFVGRWFDYPENRRKFPYSLLGPDVRGDSRPKKEPERPKEEPKKHLPDAWDDEDTHVKQTPAGEFAALAKEFGVPFQAGDSIGAAYKRLALLMHPDKHVGEEADIWTARMQRLNILREILQ